MRVNKINNTNFNGQFKNSALLQKTIKYTTTEELHTFNKLLDKAKEVADNKIFYLAEKVEKMWDKNSNKDIFIVSGELYCDQKGNIEKLCEARGGINFPHYKMISTINKALEKIYGKIEVNRFETIEDIKKNLI